MDLLQWWNLIFVLPAVAALLYLGLLASGTVDTGSDADVDADLDVDLDADIDVDADLDADADVEHGIEHTMGAEQGHDGSVFANALTFIGFGRVPLSIIAMTFCFLWGFSGWAANTLLKGPLDEPLIFVWFSLGIAAVISVFGTSSLARGLARILPSTESYGSSARDLVGRLAKVRDTVTERQGRAQLYDQHGSLQEVPVRIRPGEPPIPARTEVVLLSYDKDRGVYYVLADPLGEKEQEQQQSNSGDTHRSSPEGTS